MAQQSYVLDTQTDALARLNENVFNYVQNKEAAAEKQKKIMLIMAGVMGLAIMTVVVIYVSKTKK